jgi:predicted nucleic acid-binding protein
LLSENAISYNGIILSELLIGARYTRELNFIKDNFDGLNYLDMNRDFFKYASEMGNGLQKKGKKIPLTDLLILAHAQKHHLIIFSRDRHFESLGKSIGFQYEIFRDS